MSFALDENEKTPTPVGTSRTTDNLSSLPTDQNDESEGEPFFGIDLLHKMDIDDIMELRNYFFKNVELEDAKGISLNKSEFTAALQEVAGGTTLAAAAGLLFDSLDVASSGRISWDHVLDGIIEKTESNTERMKNFWSPIDPKPKIYGAIHCKREPIVKIVALETKTAFSYAVVSKLGRVGVYDGQFTLLDSYKLTLKPNEETIRNFDREKEEKNRRSQTTWIADVVHISDSNALLYASSDRGLHLYDANCLSHIPLCRIIGLPNVPTCLEYFASNVPGQPSLLFVGDDTGSIITMKFHQPQTSVFKKKHPDKLDNYYWSELSEQSEYVTYSIQTGIHNDMVIQMSFCSSNDTLLSCSNDSAAALVIRHVDGRREPYVFKVIRGIKCFHYERSLHLIATGSNDFIVRLWNDVVTKQPVISLYGHKAPVVDVRIIKFMSSVISLSREGVVKVWDINDYYCQMTLPIQFPILKIVGARVDFGVRSLYPGPKTIREVSNETTNSRETTKTVGASGAEEVEMQVSAMALVKKEDCQWNRRSVVVACSNHVAVLRLIPLVLDAIENDLSEVEGTLLPPPPKEHYASAPSPWKIAESYTRTPDESEESGSGKIPSDFPCSGTDCIGMCGAATKKPLRPRLGRKPQGKSSGSSCTLSPSARKTRSTKHLRRYLNFTGDSVKSPMKNMNAKRTQYVIRQEQMKMLVEQCAPHLALDLHELEPIKFSKPLPITRSMRERGVDVSEPERVLRAKIQRDSTVISLDSSSAAQSPNSSKSSTIMKKKLIPSRGRLTPDWFTDNIRSYNAGSSTTLSQ